MKRKVCVVITARPSYARVKTALKAIQEHPDLELQTVVAASAVLKRFGKTSHYIEDDGFKIDASVHMVVEGENLVAAAKTTGLGLVELATVFDNLKPDVVITIADRYETISTSIAAAYMNIPLAHIQGGEVTGSIDEKVRHANTKLADLHFVSTQKAKSRVCPSIDLAAAVAKNPALNFNPFDKYGGVGSNFDLQKGYLVVMQHPVTTEYDNAARQITETLYAISDLEIPTFWFWPNVDAGSDQTSGAIRSFRELERQRTNHIHFFKNMEPEDFLRLIINSQCLIGNSSVGIRECSFLSIPVVNIGTRQIGRERGPNVLDCGHSRHEIRKAVETQLKKSRPPQDLLYGNGDAGKRIAAALASAPLSYEKQLQDR